MALAPFFDKTALAAATVLAGFDRDEFAAALERHVVGIFFDDRAASTVEGRTALELLTNLFARFYPRIGFVAHGAAARDRIHALSQLAAAINPTIDIVNDATETTAAAVLGDTAVTVTAPTIYTGSEGWIVRVSRQAPMGFGETNNPFAAAASACFAAANIFRAIFVEQLVRGELDESFEMSLLDLDPTSQHAANPPLLAVDLTGAHLVGAGAIGNGALWVLARTPGLTGALHIVDAEDLERSNLQRYVLSTAEDEGRLKVEIATREFSRSGSRLRIYEHAARWGRYLADIPYPWPLDLVAVALDTARDRVAVQASLPRRIVNAWTQAGDLGVSRHDFVGDDACLACLYMPVAKTRNEDELVANAIGLPGETLLVRRLLHDGCAIGEDLIGRIAEALGVASDQLLEYADRPLRAFYLDVCGGVLLRLGAESDRRSTEVPMAFQSALAGVLLAAALIAEVGRLPSPSATKCTIDLLRPLGSHLGVRVGKHPSGGCLCQDERFRAAFARRHPAALAEHYADVAAVT